MPTLSLIVPVFNAPDLAGTLSGHLPALKTAAADAGYELIEAIFADDGSSRPLELPSTAGGVPVHVWRSTPNRGKGFVVRRAALMARGDFVLMSDVDESAPLTEFPRLAAGLNDEVWLVCGSRYKVQTEGDRADGACLSLPWHRRLLSRLFNLLVRLVGVGGISDTQCGFQLVRMARLRPVLERLRIDRFAFDVELIAMTRRSGGAVAEIQVSWHGGRRSSLRVARDAPRMFWDLMRIAWRTVRIPPCG